MREDESTFEQANEELPDQTGQWTTNGSGTSGATPAAATEGGAPDGDSDDEGAAFLADLARAMQTTAGAERLRVAEDTERRHQAHLARIRSREASEAEDLAEIAEVDVKGIDAWADGEIERIQRERERRILARRRDLESSLEDHRILVAREVDAVEAAIVGYRTDLETFFGRLEAETDPVAIARQAGTRPTFPVLESIGPDDAPAGLGSLRAEQMAETVEPPPDEPPAADSSSTGEATDEVPAQTADTDEEAAVVGVMDQSGSTEAETSDDTPIAPVAPLVGAGSPTAETGRDGETAAQASAVIPRSSAALLQAVPSLRPMAAWFRRDGDHGHHPDEG